MKTMRIASAANTIVPAYLTLKEKGYTVRYERHHTEPYEETWYAEKENVQLVAEDPVMLLGLLEILEHRGQDWKASDEEITAFMETFDYNC